MNRAEQFELLAGRIAKLPNGPLNAREGVLAYFIGSLKVIAQNDTVQCDEVIRVLTSAVEMEERLAIANQKVS